jgi:hypothetical protein
MIHACQLSISRFLKHPRPKVPYFLFVYLISYLFVVLITEGSVRFELNKNLYDWILTCRKEIEESAKSINCEAKQHFAISAPLLMDQYLHIIHHFRQEVNSCDVLQCASK